MPAFGKISKQRLATCDQRLINLFEEVVKEYDCTIICGHRTKAKQNKAFHDGFSTLQFPQSKHNLNPSIAVDVAPYFLQKPHIRWNDTKSFILFAGYVKGIATSQGLKIRWGGDWDNDWDVTDQTFNDLPHFELIE